MGTGLVRIAMSVPTVAAAAFEAALADAAVSLSTFEEPPAAASVRIEALACAAPDRGTLACALALAAAASRVPVPEVTIESVAERDWAEASRASFPPFRLGRFFVHPRGGSANAPAGAIGLALDAGPAFGSGRHGSTAGCLLALDGLRHHPVRLALDLGCGSGILAIAAAKLWRAKVLATDVDPQSVAVARANAHANGVGDAVRAIVADGVQAGAFRRSPPFDLVMANILAPPLKRWACGLAGLVAPHGRMVLGGFLVGEGAPVLAAYRAHGLRLVRRIVEDGWLTLVLAGGRAPRADGGAKPARASSDV